MLPFDLPILHALNQYVGISAAVDDFIIYVANDYLVKLTPMILVICGFWFMKPKDGVSHKPAIVNGLLACFITMAAARGLSRVLPFRVRPLHNPELGLQIPATMAREILDGWSSLPSDHAALSFAIATVICMLHRRWGLWALFHAAVVLCLPRAYLSLHYPSDLLAGALVGVATVCIMMRMAKNNPVTRYLVQAEVSHPALFYIGFVFLLSEMMQMFDPLRKAYAYLGPMVYHALF